MNLTTLFPVWELIFPKECVVCHSRTGLEVSFLCTSCSNELRFLDKPIYQKDSNNLGAQDTSFSFDYAQAVYPLSNPLRTLIHDYKYNEMTKIGQYLADCAVTFLKQYPFPELIDIVCPIPLHTVKKRMRGFNQAEILSSGIANHIGTKHVPHLVKRKKFTQTQTRLKKEERLKNVSDAFLLNRKWNVKEKVILIVDDVFTTGSTANSISAVLKKNGAKRVFILTIARA